MIFAFEVVVEDSPEDGKVIAFDNSNAGFLGFLYATTAQLREP
jgi:hypothetical protein